MARARSGRGSIDRRKIALVAFAASTLLLVLNDRVFKGRSELPGWLTGKLSDFIGLIVAPLALIVLLSARSRRARFWCTLSPAVVFALINLSSECSNALVGALAMIGLSWRLWPDPSDLWALGAVPVAWMLGSWLARPTVRLGGSRGVVSASGLTAFAAAVACLATGVPPDPRHSAPAYLVNRTGKAIEVEVAYLIGEVDCASGPALPSDFLRHDDFAQAQRYALEPNGVLPLADCGPVRAVLPDRTIGVDWDGQLSDRTLKRLVTEADLQDTRQLVLIPESGTSTPLTFGEGTRRLGILDDGAPLPVSDCAQAALPRLEFSAENDGFVRVTVVERRAVSDTCFRLTVASEAPNAGAAAGGEGGAAGEGGAGGQGGAAGEEGVGGEGGASGVPEPLGAVRDLYLCMPESAFPFAAGDVLNGAVFEREIRLWREPDGSPAITLYRGPADAARWPLAFENADCGLIRDACGAVWQALDASYRPSLGRVGTPLVPGEPVGVEGSPPVSYHLVRALRPVVVRPDCDPASESFTPWIEFIQRRD